MDRSSCSTVWAAALLVLAGTNREKAQLPLTVRGMESCWPPILLASSRNTSSTRSWMLALAKSASEMTAATIPIAVPPPIERLSSDPRYRCHPWHHTATTEAAVNGRCYGRFCYIYFFPITCTFRFGTVAQI